MERLCHDLLQFPPRPRRSKTRVSAPAGPGRLRGHFQLRLPSHLRSWRLPSPAALPSRRRGWGSAKPNPPRVEEGKEKFSRPRGAGYPYLGVRGGRRGRGRAAGRAAGAAAGRRRAPTPWRPQAGQGGGGRRASLFRAPPFNGGGPGAGRECGRTAGHWPGLPRPRRRAGAAPCRRGAEVWGGREGARAGKDPRRGLGAPSPGRVGDLGEVQPKLHLSGDRGWSRPCEEPWNVFHSTELKTGGDAPV